MIRKRIPISVRKNDNAWVSWKNVIRKISYKLQPAWILFDQWIPSNSRNDTAIPVIMNMDFYFCCRSQYKNKISLVPWQKVKKY